jgi:ribose transport system ATP-binding protein
VSGLSGAHLSDVDLSVHRGEIVGVSGLAGQGQRELFLTLFGARQVDLRSGTRRRSSAADPRPSDAIRAGPRHRARPGGPQERGAAPAAVGPRQPHDAGARPDLDCGVVRPAGERALVTSMVDLLRHQTTSPSLTEVGNLSGGNQQKVLLGRWILADCDVLLLFDVTRGVDVATKHEIYDLIMVSAGKGKGILLYSSRHRGGGPPLPPRAGAARRPGRR